MCHLLGIVWPEAFLGTDGDVELVAGCKPFDGFLQGNNDATCDAEHYLFGIVVVDLMHESLCAVGVDRVEVVNHLYILSGFNFFHNCICRLVEYVQEYFCYLHVYYQSHYVVGYLYEGSCGQCGVDLQFLKRQRYYGAQQ